MIFVFGITVFFAFLLLLELAAEKRDLQRYPPPGRILTYPPLHVLEKGSGTPVVLLESGLAATSVSWVLTENLIARSAKVVAYDRAGLGWSRGANKKPLHLNALLSDLEALVRALQPAGPLILVGHSFGGLLVSAFTHLHPGLISGIVLVDPVSIVTYANPDPPNVKRLRLGIRLARRGAWLARLAIVRGALALVAKGQSKWAVAIGRVSARKGSSVMTRLATEVAKLPPDTYGPIRSHWSRPASFLLMAQYLELVPKAALQAQDMPIPHHIPVIILSAASATQSELAERDALIRSRPGSCHTQVPNTTHWIQLDRPDLIAEAVTQLTMVNQ